MCPHLTSVPKQMGYTVVWLDYTPYRQAGSTLWLGSRSNFSPPEFPGSVFKPVSDLGPRARNKPECEWRHGSVLRMESRYFCCVTQHYTEEICQRYFVSSARYETTSFNRSSGYRICILISELHVPVLHVSTSFSLAIVTTTIRSASAIVTSNFNLSAESDLSYEIQSKMLISTQ